MKKGIKFLIAVIILAVVCALVVFALKYKNYISIEEMYNLSKDINDYKNIHILQIETENDWNEYTLHDTYRLENKEVTTSSGYNIGKESIDYTNMEDKESISILNDEQKVYISSTTDEDTKYYNANILLQKADDNTSLMDHKEFKNKYKYKGIEIVNSKECYCFELDYASKQTYWIYKDTGLVAKYENSSKLPDEDKTQVHTTLYLYEFDTVTDNEVTRPNIEEYTNNGYVLEEK